MFLGIAALGGITSQTQTPEMPTQLAAAPGWAPGPNGTFIETHTPVPAVAAAAPVASTQQTGMLLAIGAVVLVLAILAVIGSRMTPQPIRTRARVDDYRPCCGVPRGATHNSWCPTLPPDHPQAWYSNRR